MADEQPAQPSDHIPDGDEVSRLCVALPADQTEEADYIFEYDGGRRERAESVYWRKYAVEIAEIHQRGNTLAAKIACEYLGARTVAAGKLRAIRTQRGFGIEVSHFEQFGDRAHAHLVVTSDAGASIRKGFTNSRLELAHMVVEALKSGRFESAVEG